VSDAAVDLGPLYLIEGVLHLVDIVELLDVGQLLEPLALVDLLDLREHQLDGVELRRVREVENGQDVEVAVGLHRLLRLVHAQVVLVDGQGLVEIHEPDPVEELDVLPPVEGLPLDHQGFDASALGNCGAAADVALVQRLLVHLDVGALVAPVLLLDGELGEVDLVKVDDLAAKALPHVQLAEDLRPPGVSLILIPLRD
jgi:hypothetical protein